MRNVHRNKRQRRAGSSQKAGERRRIRNKGVVGLLVRQSGGSSTLGVEHS